MSQRDVDALIHALINRERDPVDGDAETILNHIAGSSFFMGRRNLPRPLQNLMREHGYVVPERGDELLFHWAKHVLGDKQWTPDTTPEEYRQHVRNAILSPKSHLVVQNAATGHDIAIIIAQTRDTVPEYRFGSRAGVELLVVYSATVGRILSAYMTESSSLLTARPSTIWLRR